MSPNALHAGTAVDLPRRAMLKLPDAAGLRIRCRTGTLWITLDGDCCDYVVEAGEQFTTDAHRPAIVYALKPATVQVEARHPAAPLTTPPITTLPPASPRPRRPAVQQPVAVR